MAGRRGLTLAVPTSPVWRVARRTNPLANSRIVPEGAWTDTGNRFDIPGAGVLYAADTVRACYVETLARFRPSPRILAEIAHDGDYMNAGQSPPRGERIASSRRSPWTPTGRHSSTSTPAAP